jgi:hypothetical protein
MIAATDQEQSKQEFSKKKYVYSNHATTINRTRNLITARHTKDLPIKLLITLILTDKALSMFATKWEGL